MREKQALVWVILSSLTLALLCIVFINRTRIRDNEIRLREIEADARRLQKAGLQVEQHLSNLWQVVNVLAMNQEAINQYAVWALQQGYTNVATVTNSASASSISD